MQRDWMQSTQKSLDALKTSMEESLSTIPKDFAGDVENERKLCRNRLYALKLVLGTRTADADDDLDEAGALQPAAVPAAPSAKDQKVAVVAKEGL